MTTEIIYDTPAEEGSDAWNRKASLFLAEYALLCRKWGMYLHSCGCCYGATVANVPAGQVMVHRRYKEVGFKTEQDVKDEFEFNDHIYTVIHIVTLKPKE